MKSPILGKVPLAKAWLKFERKHVPRRYEIRLGEVQPGSVEGIDNTEIFDILHKQCSLHGYAPRHCWRYRSQEVVCVNGSIAPHDDYGLGLVLNILIARREYSIVKSYLPSDQYLIYGGKSWQILPGQVFAFNANNKHAWISSGQCWIAQMTVKKRRKPVPKSSSKY